MNDHLQSIAQTLKENPKGLSIIELTEKSSLNRNSLARYLDVLTASGVISERVIGPAKLYRYEQPIPNAVRLDLFRQAMDQASCGITIADTSQADSPLIYVNDAFVQMTGYSRDEVIGRNCRFLHGADKSQPGLTKVRAALKSGTSCEVKIRNYRKDGSRFINNLRISPIRNTQGVLTHFVGIQTIK